VDVFECDPKNNQNKITLVLLIQVSPNSMKDIHHNAHEHGVESPCKRCHRSRIPDPPGCCYIPDKECGESIEENTEPVEILPVFQDVLLDDQ
jgi:hypothetical protein